MANIFDYVKWRGDLTLEVDKFNEIDALILSRFSYFPFDHIIKNDEIATIKTLGERFENAIIKDTDLLWPDDDGFFKVMSKAKRYRDLKAFNFVNNVSIEEEKQFSAITIMLPDDTLFVSYRGTDMSIIGWKEDMNMSFMNHTASQKEALKYLEKIATDYPNDLILGGHSKGGNLAMYAGIFAHRAIKSRILAIYNYEGPGFMDEVTSTQEYKDIINKITTYMPQDAIFGRLLNHEENCSVVKSTAKGLLEHDIYSWQVEGKEFVYLEHTSNRSDLIDKSITTWLEGIDPKVREIVINVIFEVIYSTNEETLLDLRKNWITHAKVILYSYNQIDPETKKMIIETLKALVKITTNNYLENRKTKNRSQETKKAKHKNSQI